MSSNYADLCCLKPLEDFLHIQVIGKPILIYFSFLIAFLTFLHKSIKNALKLWNIVLRIFSPILVRIQPHAGGWYCTVLYCTVLCSKFLAPNFDGRRVRNVNCTVLYCTVQQVSGSKLWWPESEECKRKRDQVSRGSGPGEAAPLPASGWLHIANLQILADCKV